jgi:ribosomal protein S12 methylthiotransferase accessory factor
MDIAHVTAPVTDHALLSHTRQPTAFRENTADHWRLERLRKYSDNGVERSIHPRETIRRAVRIIDKIGVTRVADVTGLDRLGIPNYMTVRPRDLGPGISYYNGKGTTAVDAHAGALMEAVERHAGEYCHYKIIVDSYRELKSRFACVDPQDVIVPQVRSFSADQPMEWVSGYDVINDRETLVPLNFVICPYHSTDFPTLFFASSNGLASGNTLTEALGHALCEVIERDAESMSLARLQIAPTLSNLLRDGQKAPARHKQPYVRLSTLPRRARTLVRKMENAGLKVLVRDLTSTAGIATFDCAAIGDGKDGFGVAHGGYGTHPDARVAVLRALTEAAQSRITCIQGGREDLPQIMREKMNVGEVAPFEYDDSVNFNAVPSVENAYIDDDVRVMLQGLVASGLSQVIAFDMTHPDVGLPVVRVIVPRAETWSAFHVHTGRGHFGPRVSEELLSYV